MELDSALVFVETNRKLAKYVYQNLEYHANAFPDTPIFLASDDKPTGLANRIVWIDARSSIFTTEELSVFKDLSKQWTFKNQHAYWSSTTKRLLVLQALQRELSINRLIHLESDSMLLDEAILDLREIEIGGISYPLQNLGLGCASILVVQESLAFKELINFILQRWQRIDTTDMQILGEFSSEFPELVSILPSKLPAKIIYDPVIYGRYLLGSDARHYRFPRSNFGYIEEVHKKIVNEIVDIKAFIRRGESNQQALGVRVEFHNGQQSLLGNLHVHSKRIRNIDQMCSEINSNWSVIRKDKLQFGSGADLYRGKLDRLVLLERILTKLVSLRKPSVEIRLR